MKHPNKIWIALGVTPLILGCLLFAGVMSFCGWDFYRLRTENYETNTYEITDTIRSIHINTETAEIVFAPSPDGSCRVVCYEPENRGHAVQVRDGILTVAAAPLRHWYLSIGIRTESPEITVYLPGADYDTLCIMGSTGDACIPEDFSFRQADVTLSTGELTFLASVSQSLSLKLTTGSLLAEDIRAGSISLSSSTGSVTARNIHCTGEFSLRLSTGRAVLEDIACGSLRSTGSTGDIRLTRVTATDSFFLERTTGDVRFDSCDAPSITVTTSTGSVEGTLLTDKVFTAETSTGAVDVPRTATGGSCRVTTSTGDIRLKIA